ncbi:P-loop containing nucleoside triphosphate hydrolase protein [Cyathus striatus]|nr:P-loop containing nucleoside triphosphate hydrolase protein [Cyathus striatus]
MEPHPPYCRPTALEARHWGATYALYRFCNGIQLNRVLPPGPRDYWNELAAEHKLIPDHQKWMYGEDPFAAQLEVSERQNKAAKRRDDTSGEKESNPSKFRQSNEYAQAPEVKMATGLRELVEESIKQALKLYPDAAADIVPTSLSEEDSLALSRQLNDLGFSPAQIRNATEFLSSSSSLASILLRTLSRLEAAIEFLILNVPECDLPRRFLPANNSSNPFVTGAYSGSDNLKRRWIEDKAVKVAGWPIHLVKECIDISQDIPIWEKLLVTLGRRLIGEDLEDETPTSTTHFPVDTDEFAALGAELLEPGHFAMPLFTAPVTLHILFPSNHSIDPSFTPVYITSASVPPYIRLHLLSKLFRALRSGNFLEPGEGFCMAAMRILEGEWAVIEEVGPPQISAVLQHILPHSEEPAGDDTETSASMTIGTVRTKKNDERRTYDARSNEQIKLDFETSRQNIRCFESILSNRKSLPAFAAQEVFLRLLENSRIVVVVGETGCGKTTQLPQFILDSLILDNRGSEASILVTQPRRVSAISVAARVSQERLEDGSVGYAIRGERKQSSKTKLLFCTTGIVLRRLATGDGLRQVSHIIVDEVHERSVDGDFLLLELKELLKTNPRLKVILMSATINQETFVRYFDGAPLLTIPGFTYPVLDKYLEDVLPIIDYQPKLAKTPSKGDSSDLDFRGQLKLQGLDDDAINAIQQISKSDSIDYKLIAAIVDYIVSNTNSKGGILIFLPGVNEIRLCIDALKNSSCARNIEYLPLHANLTSEEQMRVFRTTERWKVVVATNIAETSITIDDITHVVDTGRVKETQYDASAGLTRLMETWTTRAAARQRRGRAGRTRAGTCYKLYTRKREASLSEFPIPEIMRVPLESICLTVKVTKEKEDVKNFLQRAIDPPNLDAMDRAWSILEELGAVDVDDKVTPLGRHISMLPVDIRLAKMLVLGSIFQCLDPILTITACLSSKPLFTSPIDKREEASRARIRFSSGNSDLLTDLRAYEECMRLRAEGHSQSSMKIFCEDNFISPTTVRDITMLRQEFASTLADLGFIPISSVLSSPELNLNSQNFNLIKAILLGGLWPNVVNVHLPKSAIKFDKVHAGTIQRANTAREFKLYDAYGSRVFLHPGSILFGESSWKSPFVTYFQKQMTTKLFLRDATEVPLYGLLLFGGVVSVNHIAGGVVISRKGSAIKLKAWPRIGVLVNQLRRLLDAQLQQCIEKGSVLNTSKGNPVMKAILALLTYDGLSE